MTKPARLNLPEVRTEVVPFEGGLNESVSSLEMKPGELILCKNYYITEGSIGGYVSIPGFERFDGQESPSSIVATEEDDTDREAARAAIGEVPGVGPVLGSFGFLDKRYAFRNKILELEAGLYESTPSGWAEIDTSLNPLSPGGKYSFTYYNFGGSIGSVVLWANGTGKSRMFNGTTVTVIDNSGMDPNDKPTFLVAAWDRAILVYSGGSVQSSNVGDPTDWSTGTKELLTGFEVTSIQDMVGDTIIITGFRNIKVLKRSDTGTDWFLQTFSDVVGAYPYTVQKIFDTLIFMSDMGVVTLEATQNFGDFATASVSEKIKRTLLKYKSNIVCAIVIRDLNQYRLFFDNGKFLIFSFYNKKLRGVTLSQYTTPVLSASESKNTLGNPIVFFTSSQGFLYQMDVGTSFDGSLIDTRLSTAYYHYRSPRNWKSFQQISIEVSSIDDLVFGVRASFDYAAQGTIKAAEDEFFIPGAGSVWGEGLWGTMLWAGSETTNRVMYKFNGIGSNMSISIYTSEKYNRSHTVQNMITDFIIAGRQL